MKPLFECPNKGGCYALTADQATALGLTDKSEVRGEMKTYGPWQLPVSYRALAVSRSFAGENYHDKHSHPLEVYGVRTMTHPKESGYALEGMVSLGGRKYRAFTSSVLFQLPGGRLIDVATIHVCLPRETKE